MTAAVILAGVGYGASVIDAAGVYGLMIIASIIAAPGYARWDERRHSQDRR